MRSYYKTAKGNRRHVSYNCANQRRAISSGTPILMSDKFAAEFAPCGHCCKDEVSEARAKKAAAPAKPMCRNSGVRKPKHIQSECRDCGKRGTVNRSTGKLRAHAA